MNKKYDAIMCDLGNVLINFDHRIAVRKILKYTPKKEEDIYTLFFDSPITGLYEEGKIYPLEFFRRVKESLSLDIARDTFFQIWNDIFFETPLNLKMQAFLKDIGKQYKMVMVSNINETHFEFLKKKMPIFGIFHKLVLSYEAGFRKPAPEIYNTALKSINSSIDQVLYIDDRKDLVEAAFRLGIEGIVFDGEKALGEIKGVLCRGI